MYDLNYQLHVEKNELLEQLQGVCKEKGELVRQYYDHTTSFIKALSVSSQNIETTTEKNETAFK